MRTPHRILAAFFAMTVLFPWRADASGLPESPPLPPLFHQTLPLKPPAPPRRVVHEPEEAAKPLAANPAELCGSSIDGLIVEAEVAPPISEGVCGRNDVLLVTALGTARAIPIAGETRLSCAMTGALARWLGESVDQAATRHFGSPLAELPPGVSYACRTRNHQPGARLSEHASANAFDIRAFVLQDGRAIPVLPIDGEDNLPDDIEAEDGETPQSDTDNEPEPKVELDPGPTHLPGSPMAEFQREIRASACGPFMTVLGPGADDFHDDHLHLDMAKRRNRTPYCR
ncbi:MAG: extensin family protein [Pseudomonadota bacterium]